MSSKLDKSLDEIASEMKGSGGRGGRGGRARGGPRGGGGGGGGRSGYSNGSSSYSNPLARGDDDAEDTAGPVRRERRSYRDTPGYGGAGRADADDWSHDRFDQIGVRGRAAPASAAVGVAGTRLESSTKVLVANLDPSVGADDIKEIFQNLGNVVKAVVHYDQNSRSLGSAEVTFTNLATATRAVEEYDGAEVDGRPMTLKLLAGVAPPPRNIVTKRRERVTQPSGGPRRQSDGYEDARDRMDRGDRGAPARRPTRGGPVRSGGRGGRGGRGGGGGGGGGGGRSKRDSEPAPSSDSLDKEMEMYQSARGGSGAAPTVAAGQPSAPSAAAAAAAPAE